MRKRRRFISITASAATALACSSAAAAQFSGAQFGPIEEAIRAEMAAAGVPGAAVAVVSGGRVLYAMAFGVSSSETGTPVSTNMLFRIGPLTRVFTSAAMLVLEEEGRIDVNAPIRECLVSLPRELLQITPHQLLTETAGFRAIDFAPGPRDERAIAYTLAGVSEKDLFTAPGTVYSQSALGYAVAAGLIEVAAGGPFADIVRSRVLDPIGMHSSTFRIATAITRPFALGHTSGTGSTPAVVRPFPENTVFAPAELMFSSIDDLAKFAIAFMNGGQIEGRNALSPRVITQLSGRYAPVPSGGRNVAYGYGLIARTHRGVRLLEQAGSTPGFTAALRMAPDHQFAVIILANRDGARFDRTLETAMELLLPVNGVATSKSSSRRLTVIDRQQLPGNYRNGDTTLQIIADSSGLALVQDGSRRHLQKVDDIRFALASSDVRAELAVVRAPGGRVAYLHALGRAYARVH